MMIDLDRCVGCQACVTSCKERWDSGTGAARDWVYEYTSGKRTGDLGITFYPGLCMQCEEHPCTQDCPTGATYMDEETGVVMVDPDVCIGCSNCVSMCPYGARKPDSKKGIVEKCNLCAPYVKRGEEPACVKTCMADCRFFGDLDDPDSDIVRRIKQTGAQPLKTAEIDVKPKVSFAGARHRERIIEGGALKKPEKSLLTRVWTTASRPFASYVVPAFSAAAVVGGMLLNLKNRKEHIARLKKSEGESAITLSRHRAGMRFLHWFNALSWVFLLLSGIGLMSAASFALFGTEFPAMIDRVLGGRASVMKFHVVLGLLWAVVIIPVFLVYKKGGIEALKEVILTKNDLEWLRLKPFSMLGMTDTPLPEQEKYNAGQKLFAMAVIAGTAAIIITGLIMAFHLGPPEIVAACILVHKLAVAVTFMGVAVHVTMAAVLREERPALKSMITGKIDYEHAREHNAGWVREIESRRLQED